MQWTEKLMRIFRNESGPEIRGSLSLAGNLHFPKGGRFDSHLKGKISSRQTLLLGSAARVEGDIRAEDCQIQGKFEGRLEASGSVRIDSQGHYSGKMLARSLRVEPNANFQSELSIEPHPTFDETPRDSILLSNDPSADPNHPHPLSP